jgi:hypothetical protein
VLHRDVHLFVNDGRHVIVVSFAVSAEPSQREDVPEALNSVPLEDYVVHLIDAHTGYGVVV